MSSNQHHTRCKWHCNTGRSGTPHSLLATTSAIRINTINTPPLETHRDALQSPDLQKSGNTLSQDCSAFPDAQGRRTVSWRLREQFWLPSQHSFRLSTAGCPYTTPQPRSSLQRYATTKIPYQRTLSRNAHFPDVQFVPTRHSLSKEKQKSTS